MSNIDKQADSVSRIIADLKLKHGSGDTYAPIMRWDELMALLDELEKAKSLIEQYDAENTKMGNDIMKKIVMETGLRQQIRRLEHQISEMEAAEKRIAEPSGQKRLIGWRASDYTDETSDPELAKNWAAAIGVLPIFEGDVNTKLSAAGIGKGE